MKKLLSLLFIGLLTACFSNTSLAQTHGYNLYVEITDQYGYPVQDSAFIRYRNQDSTTTSVSPYHSIRSYSGATAYRDTGTVDSNYADSSITILYRACGQWFILDTFFHLYTHNVYWLWVSIKAPCLNPCHAGFQDWRSTPLGIVAEPALNSGPFIYHWYYGDGTESFSKNASHIYASPGTYTLSLVILDTLNFCRDSTAEIVTISPYCNTYFNTFPQKYGHVKVVNMKYAETGFQHTWKIGDSIFSSNGGDFFYRFGAGGFKPIKHIVEYPGHCKDSFTRNVNPVPCQTAITSQQLNFNTLSIVPENNIDTFVYDFGDGNMLTAAGPISHNYGNNATYWVKISDKHYYCSQKTIQVVVNQSCSGYFGSQISGIPSKMNFFTTQSTSHAVRRIIQPTNDTLYGDSVSYTFPARGQYSVLNQFVDSLGNVICTNYQSVSVSGCGYFGWQHYWKDLVYGEVRFGSGSSNYDSVKVYLIEHDSVQGTLTAVDSAVLYSNPNDTGYFEFFSLCDSTKRYLVKAALLPGSGLYANYLPTYYNQSTSWSGASKIAAGNFVALNMLAGTNPGGPGFIGGYISQGANKKFKPLEGIQVTLFDDNDVALDFRTSDVNGYYEFPSLPYGTYRVTVEILGKHSDSYWITLDANHERAEEQDFEVNSTYVSTLNTGIQLPEAAGKIYPNPAQELLIIEWTDQAEEEISLRFYSIQGQLIHEVHLDRDGESITVLNVKDLPRGVYFLHIESGNTQSINRVQLK